MTSLSPLVFLALTAYGAWSWRRSGLRVPRFVHVLALLGLGLGAWMVWLDITSGELTWRRAVVEMVMMPWLVYAAFFAYSSRLRAARAAEVASRGKAAPEGGAAADERRQ